ncbi:hypothetical protein PGQ11_001645 [Apiospora arundinis]|uniref:Uncharacterized protein n=1 Tax=Apiospora arundinis TaxID=335852 RepID=A0ABR2JFP5_9PEZI
MSVPRSPREWYSASENSGQRDRDNDSVDLCEFSDDGSLYGDTSSLGGVKVNLSDDEDEDEVQMTLERDVISQVETVRSLMEDQVAQHSEESVQYAAEIASLKTEVLQLNASEVTLTQQLERSQSEIKNLQSKYDLMQIGMVQKCKALEKTAEKHRAVAEKALAAIRPDKNTMVFQDLGNDRLVEKVINLRRSIKAFGQLFLHTSATSCWSHKELRHMATFGHAIVKDGLRVTPPSMEAYTWYVLVHEVFGRFVWAGKDMMSLQNIWRHSKKAFPKDSTRVTAELLPTVRKIHIWRATTASLVLDDAPTSSGSPPHENERMQQVTDFITLTCRSAFPTWLFSHIYPGDQCRCQVRIGEILAEAVKLDAEIARQGSRVDWEFNCAGYGVWTNPEVLGNGVSVVTAPALLRLGTSKGEDLDKQPEVLLVREHAVIDKSAL